MNIWILNHYAVSSDMAGGTRHYDFGKELAKRGYKVTIFASSFHYSQHKELKLAKNEGYKVENINGISFVWIKTFPYQKNDWRRVINMISYMGRVYHLGRTITKSNRKVKKPDIIIGSSVHLLAVLTAYRLSKHYKAKFIMEVRDLWPQTLVDMGKFKENNLIIIFLRFLEKFLYLKAKGIITLLPLAEKYITSLGINKDKIVWIPNGVDSSLHKNIDAGTEKSRKDFFKAMYVGAHGKANALEVILDAAKIIQDKGCQHIKVIFVGDGPEKKNLIKYKNKLGLLNTGFYEPVVKKEVPAILNRANVLIVSQKNIALYQYGFSYNKLFDYMAAEKPIVLGGKPINDLVTETGCGISVLPENPKEMAEAIIRIYQMSHEERKEMGKRGREYVEKHHSIPVLVNKLEKVIREVVNGKTVPEND